MDLLQQAIAVDPSSHILITETLIGIALAYFSTREE